jgi:hypothetical protein
MMKPQDLPHLFAQPRLGIGVNNPFGTSDAFAVFNILSMRDVNTSGLERKGKLSSFRDHQYPIVFEGDIAVGGNTHAMKSKYLVVILSLITIGLPFAWSASEPQHDLTDDDIRQKIVGTWLVETHLSNGNSVIGTETILLSNSMVSKATLTIGDTKEELEYNATWQVKDGYLIETVTKSNSEGIPLGKITRDKVVTLDDNVFIFQTESGRTVARKRSK